MFDIAGGETVNFWSNGVLTPGGAPDYGVAVATSDLASDYVAGGVTASVPEPSTWSMMLLGFTGLGFAGYRSARKGVSIAT